ncbi:helicase associated domain-containing protein [Prescottella agglutinans]|uniref:Helicase-associated domain-containing protein n=1 Tax=Prescottella agglutinans TaxID=1644129 RepID=A0ABT6MLH4_9NOCA|nr:helicase associated domain-containing protein [Prescottella agglutinans]MDH6284676.1 hypothetical protein [Prescottella agglutinans]
MHGRQSGDDARTHALWANGIEHLEDFITEHGHARVLARFVCSDGMRLGRWVNSRRAERRHGSPSLTNERIAQLDRLGFVWDPPRGRIDAPAKQWVVGLAHLEQYVAVHGHARVPYAWVSEDGFALGNWVSNRRRDRRDDARALTPERVAQLDALSFDWLPENSATRQNLWATGIDHLTEFITEHGHALVPTGWTSPDGFNLGAWVMNRRADRRIGRPSLTTDRIDHLERLGFHWGTARVPPAPRPPTQWDNAVDHLAQFVAEHGHARIQQKWVAPDGFKLGAWVAKQRTHRRAGTPTLTPTRIAQLDALDFEWEPPRGPRMT